MYVCIYFTSVKYIICVYLFYVEILLQVLACSTFGNSKFVLKKVICLSTAGLSRRCKDSHRVKEATNGAGRDTKKRPKGSAHPSKGMLTQV